MNAADKFRRILRPQSLADYRLSITEAELRTFPEGRSIICHELRRKRADRWARRHAIAMANVARRTIERIAVECLQGG